MRLAASFLLGLLAAAPALAAINPAGFQRVATDHVRLHETARIVDEYVVDGHKLRRVTLVGTLVEEVGEEHGDRKGQVFVIDYTVDLDARTAALEAWQAENGNRPGPQFLSEPNPPELDAEGNFWAHLAEAGTRTANVNRHAGAVLRIDQNQSSGPVYVPVAADVSFERPLY
jgi:hypothetical protein